MHYIIMILTVFFAHFPYIGVAVCMANKNFQPLRTIKFWGYFFFYLLIIVPLSLQNNSFLVLSLLYDFYIMTFIIYANSKLTFSKSFSLMFINYLFVSIIQAVVVLLVGIFAKMDPNNYSNPYSLLVMFLTAVFAFLLFYLIPSHWFEKGISFPYINIITLLLCIVLLTGILSFFGLDMNLLVSSFTTIVICLVLLFFCLYQVKNDLKKQQMLKDYATYLPILDKMILGIQQRQHLYKNQFLSLSQLLESGNTGAVKSTLHQMTALNTMQEHSYQFLHLQNRLLSGLLYTKMLAAQKQDIHLDIQIDDPACPCQCSDVELVDLVDRLLDKAIQTCSEKDTIHLSISSQNFEYTSKKQSMLLFAKSHVVTSIFKHNSSRKKGSVRQEKQFVLSIQCDQAGTKEHTMIRNPLHKLTKQTEKTHELIKKKKIETMIKKYHGELILSPAQSVQGKNNQMLTIKLLI